MNLGRQLFRALLGCLLGAAPLGAQGPTGTVAGRVVDAATQRPLSGARVVVAGTQRRTVSRADGGFVLTGVPSGPQRVRASMLGYGSQQQAVTVAGGATTTAQFALQPEAVALEELVAVGYGTQRREATTGSVATVSAEQADVGRVVSPEELLQGRVAGVQVINSGEPGGVTNLRIRGGTSVSSSNEPLFVVDGVPLPVGGGLSAGRNPLNFINPEDIQSLTVLKDAASTAIYGSRGANGVVLIETKSGTTRGPQFTYGTSVSQSNVTRRPDLLTAEEFRKAVAENAPEKTSLLGGASTDWYDAVLRSGTGQEHTLAVAGTGDAMNYRLSLGYLGQEGVVQGSSTERISGSLNYNHVLFNDRLSVRAHLRGARTEDDFTPGGVLGSAAAFAPTQPIETDAGFFEWTQHSLAPNNPLAELALAVEEGLTNRTIGNVEGQYRLPFLTGLTATGRLGYDFATSERRNFRPSTMRSEIETSSLGFVDRSNPSELTTLFEGFANYVTAFGTDSDVDATAGYSYESFRGDYPYFFGRGLSTDLLGPNAVPTARERNNRLDVTERRLASFFGRLNYTFRDRYLLTLSVRHDGSSRFGPANQWGTFPAAALGWRISDESFMDGIEAVSDLKLRASWGVNGNQAFGDYLWISSYQFSDAFARAQFGNEFVNTIRPSAVDPNIKWEETTSYNLGLDYGLFGNRITGAVEYYLKDTDDLIFNVPVAAGTNLSNFVTTNIGSVRNQGVELSLNARLLDRGGFSWDAGLNASTNRNRLLQINPFGGGSEQILVGGISGGVGSTIQVLQPGQPVNSFFVYRHKRDANGRPLYADVDKDGDIDENDLYEDLNNDKVVNLADRAPFESPAPNWTFGHTSNMAFRNFDLGWTLRAQVGNYVYNNLASNLGNYRELSATGAPVNLHRSVLETGFATPQYFSDVYVEDASFLRMDNLTLGYTFSGVRSVQQMRIFGTVQNVFTLTGYSGLDPEVATFPYLGSPTYGIDNNIYPRSRTFTVGASVGF